LSRLVPAAIAGAALVIAPLGFCMVLSYRNQPVAGQGLMGLAIASQVALCVLGDGDVLPSRNLVLTAVVAAGVLAGPVAAAPATSVSPARVKSTRKSARKAT